MKKQTRIQWLSSPRIAGQSGLKRCVAALTALGVAPLFLAGCPSKPNTTQPTSSAPQNQVSVLRVWQTETDPDAIAALNGLKTDFERAHPGVRVEIESVGWGALATKLATAVQSGNEPDVTHLEPFMVRSMVAQGKLLPMDEVIASLEKSNGPIFPVVRDLQLFDGKRYGIAYALGTTGFGFRRDVATRLKLQTPKTWPQYLAFARAMAREESGRYKVLLPGGDPFFIDQLFAEMLANNGGQLFDAKTNKPLLTSTRVVQTLAFFRDLSPSLNKGWQTQSYKDQFSRLARSEVGNVPVTYVRAIKALEAESSKAPGNSKVAANPQIFGLLPQPAGPSLGARPTVATVDCEPYSIFTAAQTRAAGKYGTNADLAKEFLKSFYAAPFYLRYCQTVPIHLTPIFEKVATSKAYLDTPLLKRWSAWDEQCRAFLKASRVRPILMPDADSSKLPFLLEFQASKILTDMVTDVTVNKTTPEAAATRGQKRAEELVESLDYKKW